MSITIVPKYTYPPHDGCQNNCISILAPGESLPPIPEPLPPEGTEWVYDIWNEHVLDVDGNWVYTDI